MVLRVSQAQRRKIASIFPCYFRQDIFYPNRFEGFVKRSNINHSKPSVSIILNNGASLNFVTFVVPKKVKEKAVDLFYNLRVTLKNNDTYL